LLILLFVSLCFSIFLLSFARFRLGELYDGAVLFLMTIVDCFIVLYDLLVSGGGDNIPLGKYGGGM
jgi:hypothetical protein